MTLNDLRNLFDEKGIEAADRALEEAGLPHCEESDFLEALNAWNLERQRRWTHPSRYPAAYERHEF